MYTIACMAQNPRLGEKETTGEEIQSRLLGAVPYGKLTVFHEFCKLMGG